MLGIVNPNNFHIQIKNCMKIKNSMDLYLLLLIYIELCYFMEMCTLGKYVHEWCSLMDHIIGPMGGCIPMGENKVKKWIIKLLALPTKFRSPPKS